MKTVKQMVQLLKKSSTGTTEEDLRMWAVEIIHRCAEVAMIQEQIPEDEQDDYDGPVSIHSGGHIREEHYVCVDEDSILDVKTEL